MKRFFKLLSIALILCLSLTLAAAQASAAKSFSDISSHWAKDFITKAVSRGYVGGYDDGTFRPNNAITRAEFCKMLNSALGLTASTTIGFSDVPQSKWYYSDVQKAVSAGYISGYDDNTFLGDNKITRQEAAVVIARIVTGASSNKDITQLRDSSSISSWALEGAKTVFSKGYISGDDLKRFNPQGSLTRAEAVKIIETVLDGENVVTSNLTVSTSGQTYSNKIYVGSVIVSSALGDGNVTFNNCRVLGTMLINGGGSSGVRLANTRVSNMTVNNQLHSVGVACAGASTVNSAYVSTPCSLTEAGLTGMGTGFSEVTLGGTNLAAKTVTLSGDYDVVNVSALSGLSYASGTIKKLNVTSAGAGSTIALSSGTKVSEAVINASCTFAGEGKIDKAVQNAANVTYAVKPTTLTGAAVTGTTGLGMEIYPAGGSKNVVTSSTLSIAFNSAVTASDGSALTSAYIQNNVELRQGSASGAKVTYYPSVSSTGKVITLQPVPVLKDDTTYYLTVKAGAFSSSGVANSAATVVFSTGDDETGPLTPSITPPDGSVMIPVDADITLKFGAKLYNNSGEALTDSYAASAIELRRSSATGKQIGFDASVSSDKKTVILTPDGGLDTSTKYYVILPSGILSDGTDKNEKQTFIFETADDSLVPSADPCAGEKEIAVDSEFTFTFETAMYKYSGASLTSSYIESDAVTLRCGTKTGAKTGFTASVSSDKKTITISPNDELDEDENYYLIFSEASLTDKNGNEIPELVFPYVTGSTEDTPTALVPATSPKNGKTGVSRTTDITITYANALSAPTGMTLDSSYLESVITLRKNTSSGTKVSFSASINSTGKVITLTPDSKLTDDTKYYVTVNSGAFVYANGTKNSKYTFNFTVGSTGGFLEPDSTSPSSGEVNVGTGSDIYIYFDEEIFDENGDELTSSYLRNDVIELRKSSASGSNVSFTAKINSNNDRITVSPSSSLSQGTRYYVIINDNTIFSSEGTGNDGYSFYFTTQGSTSLSAPTMVPASGEASADVLTDTVQLIYPNSLTDSSGKTLTANYLESYFKVTESTVTGDVVPFTAEVTSSSKVITLHLKKALKCDTKYYVQAPAGILKSGSGVSSSLSYYFTTRKPTVEITSVEAGKSTAAIKVTYDCTGASDGALVLTCNSKTYSVAPAAKKGTYTFNVDGFRENYSYSATVKLTYNSGKSVSDSESFRTSLTSTVATLSSVRVTGASGDAYLAALSSVDKNGKATAVVDLPVAPTADGKITVQVTPTNEYATVRCNGVTGSTFTLDSLSGKDEASCELVVTSESGNQTVTYTLTVRLK